MNNQEYLNQISASNRPVAPPKQGLLSSPILKVATIGVVGFIVLAIFGAVLGSLDFGSSPASELDNLVELSLYTSDTLGAINSFQPSIKSSTLRSYSSSLGSILSNTTRSLENYLDATYEDYEVTEDEEEEAKLHQDELTADLTQAKINGILDRIYAHKMAQEITIIMAKEYTIYQTASDESLSSILSSSYNSLDNLSTAFSEYSETK